MLATLAALFLLLIGGRSVSLFAQSANPIQIENQNPGTTAWLITNAANANEIEGYASLTSVNAGSQISFFVNTIDPQYTLTIYRLGYYGGLGGRQMTQPVTLTGIAQPIPTPDPTYGMAECNWSSPYVLTVPSNWVSGMYVVKLVGSQSGKQRYIVFVVRNDGRASDLMFQSSVSTYQAYNAWGGKSLYTYNSTDGVAAVKVSYNRPYDDSQGAGNLLQWELDMLAYLEQEGYDVVYSTDVDTHESPSQLLLHKGYLSVGHDEYWSYEMRQNVTAARDAGVNLGFFSADTCNWQIRFETSPITGAADRTQVGYKNLWQEDPDASNPATYYLVTATWGQARYTYPGHPEDALIGAMYNGAEPVDGNIIVTDPSSSVFANTGLTNGSAITGLLGYEASAEAGNQPADTILLAHSPYTAPNGSTAYGDMTVYQAASGATVFSTGTVQWSWGLSDISPWGPTTSIVNPVAEQITQNVLGEFINSSASPTASATGTPTATPKSSASATPTAVLATPTPTIAASPSATPTPGAVQITAPLNGANVAGTVSITLVKATNVSWANVYVDGSYFASTPPSTFNWNSTTVSTGSHVISANAYSSSSTLLGTASIVVNVQNGTATATATATPHATATGAATPTSTATGTPTRTATATLNATPTRTATSTAIATSTGTVAPTATSTLAATATSTLAPTASRTPTSTATTVPTRTATATVAPTATSTLAATATSTLAPTASGTPTSIATTAPTRTATATVAPTATSTLAATATSTLASTASRTPTSTATTVPTRTATATVAPTATSTLAATATSTLAPTASRTPTSTATTVPTRTATSTPVRTATATSTSTRTATATPVATPTATVVQITAPLNGAQVAGNVSITVVKASGVTWANVYIDGTYFASTPPGTFNWNSKTVADGAHTISANGYNSGGGLLGTASISVTVSN